MQKQKFNIGDTVSHPELGTLIIKDVSYSVTDEGEDINVEYQEDSVESLLTGSGNHTVTTIEPNTNEEHSFELIYFCNHMDFENENNTEQ